MGYQIIRNRLLSKGRDVMQNTTQNGSPDGLVTGDKEANLPNRRYRRVLHNLKVGIDLPYNLHTLQLAMMQEKTLILAVNL